MSATVATARGLGGWPARCRAFRQRTRTPTRMSVRGSFSRFGNAAGGGRGALCFSGRARAEAKDEESKTTETSATASTSTTTSPKNKLKLGTNAKQSDVDGAPHVPVLMRQVLESFGDVTLKTFVDCTMGAGGHSSAVATKHPELRMFIGFDVDPLAHTLAGPRIQNALREAQKGKHDGDGDEASSLREKENTPEKSFSFNPITANFRELRAQLNLLQSGLETSSIDGILIDLGVSSMHLDLPERGFSFNDDGPLDMRMGPSAPYSAFDVVNDWPQTEIERILRDYGEEKHWRLLARRICEARIESPIETTHGLVSAIGRVPGVKVRPWSFPKSRTAVLPGRD